MKKIILLGLVVLLGGCKEANTGVDKKYSIQLMISVLII